MEFYIHLIEMALMERRHLQETDTGYKIFLYIFYVCGFLMISITVYGFYAMYVEWTENGTYVMGEVLVTTEIPFENFAKITTWLFFSTIIGWYCVSRIGWKRTSRKRTGVTGWSWCGAHPLKFL